MYMERKEIEELFKELKISSKYDCLYEFIEEGVIRLSRLDNGMININISDSISYELYCNELVGNNTTDVTFLDVCYSTFSNDSFRYSSNMANGFMQIVTRGEEASALNGSYGAEAVCFICTKINQKEFSNYKEISDIKEPIPLGLFVELYNKQADDYEVVLKDDEAEVAGILDKITIRRGMMGISYWANINIISRDMSSNFISCYHQVEIYPENELVVTLEDLGITQATEEKKRELYRRGLKYIKYTDGPQYCKCNGVGFSKSWMKDTRHTIQSRVMIDVASMRLLCPDIDSSWYWGNIVSDSAKHDSYGKKIDNHLIWMMTPVVYGFSFSNKLWSRMLVEQMEDIEFAENAFNDLIIPENNKELFIACMTNEMPSLDSIEGKGEGKIFLLYGPPGVGKTMTAEATAEYLKKPLYFISVGELGVNPKELEHSLENVMRIATRWDAVVLLDEVDVFAVKRDGASIERNAMTAIFLRMLERYDGIMFMTTNLLKNLDDAFVSRATAVIGYKDLAQAERRSIWMKVLKKAESLGEVTIADDVYENIDKLSTGVLNGRVIKNTVRLAYTLALSRAKILTYDDIRAALNIRTRNEMN